MMSAVDRLVVKLARKIYVAPHKRVTLHGTIDVEGHWRELQVASHPTIPGATWNPKGFTPGVMHEGPIVSMRVPGQNLTVERGEVYQWTEASGEVKTARFTGNAFPLTTAQRERAHMPEFKDVDTGERLRRNFYTSKGDDPGTYRITKLGDTPGEFRVKPRETSFAEAGVPGVIPAISAADMEREGDIMRGELEGEPGLPRRKRRR